MTEARSLFADRGSLLLTFHDVPRRTDSISIKKVLDNIF